MKTATLLIKILLFGLPGIAGVSVAFANQVDLFKTEKEARTAENKQKKIKEVPKLPVTPSPAKLGPEINCTTDTGETLGPKDKGLEQCLVDSKKPTKIKGK